MSTATKFGKNEIPSKELLTTFYIGQSLFGLEVMKVQEVTGPQTVIPVPLAPGFVRGLINLRGQIATAFGLRELFKVAKKQTEEPQVSVVCRMEGNLVSLMVDTIGDVVEADGRHFEMAPETIPSGIRQYLKGIYKMNGTFLSVLDLDKLAGELSPYAETGDNR